MEDDRQAGPPLPRLPLPHAGILETRAACRGQSGIPGQRRSLYEDFYCARGEMENRIKEQQLGLFADRTSTSWLHSNQIRLYLSSIAYCLLSALRRLALVGTDMAKAQCGTIRLRLLKIGAQVRITARKIWISMAAGHPAAAVFAAAHQKLMGEMPLRV